MSTLKRKQKAQYHHGKLIDAFKKQAIKMIKQKGIAHVSLRDLATKCGVSPTALYRHYNSKEHLFAEIARDGFKELKLVILAAQEPYKLQNIGIAYIQYALNNPVKFQLMFSAFIEKIKYPELLQASMEAYHILRDEVLNMIRANGVVGNIDSLTRTAWATIHGAAVLLIDNQFPAFKNNEIDSTQIVSEVTVVLREGLFVNP